MEAARLKGVEERYYIIDGKLYLRRGYNMLEVVAPKDRLSKLSSIHQDSGHVGIAKLYNTCRRFYYWPYLLEDCSRSVR